jgi:hypothetical protein
LFRQIVMRPLAPINWKNRGVPDDLAAIVHHALAKDPDERYATMGEFAADLERFLAGKPVMAPPYRFRLDEGEIMAQRPGAVVFLACCCSAMSFFLAIPADIFTGMLSHIFLVAGVHNDGLLGIFFQASILLGIAIALLIFTWTILSGRSWGRWLGFTLGAVFCFGMVGMAIFGAYLVSRDSEGIGLGIARKWHAFPISGVFGLLAAAIFAVLFQPRVRRWFQFATVSRAAFQREREKAGRH